MAQGILSLACAWGAEHCLEQVAPGLPQQRHSVLPRNCVVTVAAAVTPAPARRAIANDGSVEVQLRDLVALLERDPHYAKSPLVYQLLEADGL